MAGRSALREQAVIDPHQGFIHHVACAPHGRQFLSANDNGTVSVFDAHSNHPIHRFDARAGSARCASWSPDSTAVAVGTRGGRVAIMDALFGVEIQHLEDVDPSTVLSLAFSGDGTRLVTGGYDAAIRVWDVSDRCVTTPKLMCEFSARGGFVKPVCYAASADGGGGASVVSLSANGGISLNDVCEKSRPKRLSEDGTSPTALAVSLSGTHFFEGLEDGTMSVRLVLARDDDAEPRRVAIRQHAVVTCAAFSRNGTLLTASSDSNIMSIFDAASGEALSRCSMVPGVSVSSAAFHPDGVRVVAGCIDGTVRVFG